MNMRRANEFQLRLAGGMYTVFMIRVNNQEVPKLKQRAVYSSPYQPRAQIVSDALNGGMLTRILLAMGGG